MNSNPIIQLVTLWFVILIFLQTGTGGGGTFNMAIGTIAILLTYIIPLTLVTYSVLQLTDN